MVKQVKYNRLNKDYDGFLNGKYIGSFSTHHAAEIELDRLAYSELTHD